MKRFVLPLLCVAPIALVALAVFLDRWVACSRNWIFEGVLLVGVVMIGVAMAAGWRRTGWLVIPSSCFLAIAILPVIDLSPVKPAMRATGEILPGMSLVQVQEVIDRHFPERGRFKRPFASVCEDGSISFILDRDDSRYDASSIVVEFTGNRCIEARFMGD